MNYQWLMTTFYGIWMVSRCGFVGGRLESVGRLPPATAAAAAAPSPACAAPGLIRIPAALCCAQWRQVLVCQMRDIESSWVVSTLGACSSFAFSFIAVGLCIDRMSSGEIYGTVSRAGRALFAGGCLVQEWARRRVRRGQSCRRAAARHHRAPAPAVSPAPASRACLPYLQQVTGIPYSSTADKVFNIMNALGTMG